MFVKVRHRNNLPATYALPEGVVPAPDETVILSAPEGGSTFGTTFGYPYTPPEPLACCQRPRGDVLRVADRDDLEQITALSDREADTAAFCQERANHFGLGMRVLYVEGVLSSQNITCFFTADGRVDFRQLVKDVGRRFRCHVLMHQVNLREEARTSGNMGPCGRELCCATFLHKPHSISSREARKMAAGNSTAKMTGVCGKLMCCLGFEKAENVKEMVSIS